MSNPYYKEWKETVTGEQIVSIIIFLEFLNFSIA